MLAFRHFARVSVFLGPNCTLVFEVRSQYLKELIILKRPFTITHSSIFIQVVARWTAALEAAKGVDAFPALAQTWELLALINIYQDEKDSMSLAL